ncbi:MAG TPA: aldolase/citrate lyase family protein [Acidisoma sp.]|jgi:4-hydroxy-2-oxoheptanedioate aldolase|nr:aldolase/citrate lyase family protein [Acidisoma sp.]
MTTGKGRPNRLREITAAGGAAVNGWLGIPSVISAEVMAHQGWDSLTIDMQHGMIDYNDLAPMLAAISTTATVPLVRAPWLEPGILGKILDAGAYGVICPMIETAADVEAFVLATAYPPRGRRSMGPIRAALYGGPGYWQQANSTILRFAMIETRGALDNLDAILAVDGLDAVYIGPSDLSLALGREPRFDQDDPVVLDAILEIGRKARVAGKIAGIHNGYPPYAKRMIANGFNFVTVGTDTMFLTDGSRGMLAEMREASRGDSRAASGY